MSRYSGNSIRIVILIILLILSTSIPQYNGTNLKNNHEQRENSEQIKNKIVPELSCETDNFIKNQGQFDDDSVRFYILNGNRFITFFDNGFSYSFRNSSRNNDVNIPTLYSKRILKYDDTQQGERKNICTISYHYYQCNAIIPEGIGDVRTYYNYIIGPNSDSWYSNIESFQSIVYRNLYDNIDLIFTYTNDFKYEFIIHPQGNPNDISISVDGHNRLLIDDEENLNIITVDGTIKDIKPTTFPCENRNTIIPSSFKIIDNNSYGFNLSDYNSKSSIIIDPIIFSSFLGGSEIEKGVDIVADINNKIYIVGESNSIDFPVSSNSPYPNNSGGSDAFLGIIDKNSFQIEVLTYFGGSGSDIANSITIDEDGMIIIGGSSSSYDFPLTSTLLQSGFSGGRSDAFLAVFSSNGTSLVFSTLIGGTNEDICNSISVLKLHEVYIFGETKSLDFPTSPNCIQPQFGGGWSDAFLVELNYMSNISLFSTYIGGNSTDIGNSIGVYNNTIILTGETDSFDFPLSNDAYQATKGNDNDLFLLALRKDGDSIEYSTYLGGSSEESPQDLSIDNEGNIYIIGSTSSDDFPTTNSSFQPNKNRYADGFILKINMFPFMIEFSSFIGGGDYDYLFGVDVDLFGNIHITGLTFSTDFPTTSDAHQRVFGGGSWDSFLCIIQPNGNDIAYSSFIGGNNNDYGHSIKVDQQGHSFIVGGTNSIDFPISLNAFQKHLNGVNYDIILVVIDVNIDKIPPIAKAGSDVIIYQGDTADFSGILSTDNVRIINYSWNFYYEDTQVLLFGINQSFTFYHAKIYNITLRVVDFYGNTDVDNLSVVVLDNTPPNCNAGNNLIINQHQIAYFDGSNSSDNTGIINWTWIISNSTTSFQLYNVTNSFLFDEAGTYYVQLIVKDSLNNSDNDTFLVTVVDTTPPYINIGTDMTLNQFDHVIINSTKCYDNNIIVNWTWTLFDNESIVTSYSRNFDFIFKDPAIYTLALNISDANNNWANSSITIKVLDTIPPLANAVYKPVIYIGEACILDGSASTDNLGIYNWTWEINDGDEIITLFGQYSTIKFSDKGKYTGILTVFDKEGNYDNDTFEIIVIEHKTSSDITRITIVIIVTGIIVSLTIWRLYLTKNKI